MRIVHVIDSLQPRRGGPPLVAASLCAALAALGHDVTVLSYAHEDAPGPGDPEPIAEQVPGLNEVRHLRLPMPNLLERITGTAAERSFNEHCGNADIVHLHQVWEGLLPAIAAAARQRSIPYIVFPHGMLHPWSMGQSRLKKKIALAVRFGTMIRHAAAIHVLNPDEQSVVEALCFGPKATVIPNGVWPQFFTTGPDRKIIDAAVPGLEGRRYLLFLARLHFKKGTDILLESFKILAAKHPDLALVMAGSDYGEQEHLRTEISKAGLTNRVYMPGGLYGEAKLAAHAHAAVFCLPSRQEGLPIGVLEAMASSRPVVISHACNMPEVQQHEAGAVLPLDATAFANSIDNILCHEQLQRAMGANGRRLVEERYTWPKVAEQTFGLYDRLVREDSAA